MVHTLHNSMKIFLRQHHIPSMLTFMPLYHFTFYVATSVLVCVCVCASSLQHVSSGECPGVDEPFEPLASVTLLQQCWQNNLKQEQLQWQLADWSVAAEARHKPNSIHIHLIVYMKLGMEAHFCLAASNFGCTWLKNGVVLTCKAWHCRAGRLGRAV